MNVVWAPRALERVREAAEYIGRDHPDAAQRWVDRLFARVELLARAPAQGRMVPELGREDIREILFQRYRVIYRHEPKRVVILTVRHGRQRFAAGEVLTLAKGDKP